MKNDTNKSLIFVVVEWGKDLRPMDWLTADKICMKAKGWDLPTLQDFRDAKSAGLYFKSPNGYYWATDGEYNTVCQLSLRGIIPSKQKTVEGRDYDNKFRLRLVRRKVVTHDSAGIVMKDCLPVKQEIEYFWDP